MRSRSRGFTLIELLVVIAIIAILAAMLFPVFARARESARKIQCLSNVKNIAMAVQIYLSDYDRFPPEEHRREAYDYFDTRPGRGGGQEKPDCNHTLHANPYLRWAVVLDEYTKNRDVYRCPSARMINSVQWIVPDYGPGGYLGYLEANQDHWGHNDDVNCPGGPCCTAFPPGWGGSVTDSISQLKKSPDGVELTIAFAQNYEMKTSELQDPSWFGVCADCANNGIWMTTIYAFPDACNTGCGPSSPSAGCCAADWVNCSDTKTCGVDWTQKAKFFHDQNIGKPFTRHLGGSNIGFADGHASWMNAYQILSESPTYDNQTAGHIRGMGCAIEFCDY